MKKTEEYFLLDTVSGNHNIPWKNGIYFKLIPLTFPNDHKLTNSKTWLKQGIKLQQK